MSERDQFRTEWQFATAPIREQALQNYQGALKFADAALKAVFALNGGGLIALPAFVALFKIDALAVRFGVIVAGAIFIGGLVAAVIASLLGYLSAMTGVELSNKQISKTSAIMEQKPAAEIATLEIAERAFFHRSQRQRKAAVVAGVVGLLDFIVGSVISGLSIIDAAPTH
jgi:hypothetical protein